MKKFTPIFIVALFVLGMLFGFYGTGSAAVNFPVETSYTLASSAGNLAAAYKFSPPIRDITFYTSNWSTYIGNHFKNIFWIANRYGGGPAGRWDISVPWAPKESDVVGIASGGAAFAYGTQPALHRGPYSSGAWPHPPALFFGGGAYNDSSDGEGRFVFDSGEEGAHPPELTEPRAVIPVISMDESGLSLGEILEEKWRSTFSANKNIAIPGTTSVVDATASGKFFLFGSGGANRVSGLSNQLHGQDISDPYEPRILSTKSWQNITELAVVEIPTVRNHVLIARTGTTVGAKPKFYVADINADSGALSRIKSFELDMNGKSHSSPPYTPAPEVLPGSNLKWASYGNSVYVFMNESYTRGGFDPNVPGMMKIAVYKLNSDLTFTRKGDITLSDMPSAFLANRADIWGVARTETGNAYPLLMALGNSSSPNVHNLRFYSLKSLLIATSPTSLTPAQADFIVPGLTINRPVTSGQVVTVGAAQASGEEAYHYFLKKEGTKTNLYLYRKALQFDGRIGDSVMPYKETQTEPGQDPAQGAQTNMLTSGFRGVAALRIDKVDVTSLISSTTATASATTVGCVSGYRYNILTGALCPGYSYTAPVVTNVKGNTAPSIGTINGPTSVKVNEQGVWTVTASDSQKDDLSWSVDWGAGRSAEICKLNPPAGTGQNSTYSFAHSWANAGNYTVRVYVNDCKGGTASKILSVTVR
jgi:hypothetical protein